MTNTVLDEGFVNRDSSCVKLIRKYTVVLGIFLLLEIVLRMLIPYLGQRFFSYESAIWMNLWSYIPTYPLNIVTAVMMYQDMKKTSTVSWSIVLFTCLFNEVGVCFFLISVAYTELQSMVAKK